MSDVKYMEDHGIPIVYLLKGVLYKQQEQAWNLLLQYRHRIIEHLNVIGLNLFVNDADGYAFVKQKEMPKELEDLYPVLMQKRQLSYLPTLLCVVLRKRLMSDQSGTEARVVISLDEIKELVKVFLGDSANEKRQEDKIGSAVKRLIEYGFLVELKSEKEKYEISRILSAYIDIQKLKEIQARLENYRKGDHEIETEDGSDGIES